MDEVKEAVTTEVQTPEIDSKVLIEQLEALKKTQAGSDKAYQEAAKKAASLQAEVERLQKEKMSEKERAEFELAKKEAELEQRAREVAEATSRLSKMKLMAEKQIPAEFADYIQGASEDEIMSSIDTFTQRFDKAVGERVQQTLTGTQKPQVGNTATKTVDYSNMSFKEMDALAREGKL
jgi:DNA repair exonuclease SbcCD ATPase subunit